MLYGLDDPGNSVVEHLYLFNEIRSSKRFYHVKCKSVSLSGVDGGGVKLALTLLLRNIFKGKEMLSSLHSVK